MVVWAAKAAHVGIALRELLRILIPGMAVPAARVAQAAPVVTVVAVPVDRVL